MVYIENIWKYNLFLRCKAEFSASLLQSSLSHDPSETILICWFAAQETFLIISFQNSSTYSYFYGYHDAFIFFDEQRAKKKQHLFERELFRSIANIFTVTFDHFNVSLLK